MKFLWKFLSRLCGPLLQLVGLFGSVVPSSSQEGAMSAVLSLITNPAIYIPSVVVGTIITTIVYGSMWAGHQLAVGGGLSRREFAADFERWDKVANFTVWQLSWLWNGLEPQSSTEPTEGTPAYPTFRWMKEQLNLGKIGKVSKKNGSWLWSQIPRQTLIDYAIETGERPRFLFPRERFWWRRLCHQMLRRYRKCVDADVYMDIYSFEASLFTYLKSTQTEEDYISIRDRTLRSWMQNEEWEAIGRRKVDGYLYEYEVIAPWKWEGMDMGVGTMKFGNEEYSKIRIRQLNKLEGTPIVPR